MALINTRTNLSDAHIGTSTPTSNVDWGGIINSGIGALQDVYGNYIDAQLQAAGMANAASAAAQQKQFEMNMALMGNQIAANTQAMREAMAFNAQSAKEANALNYQMQQEAMAYNAQEADKQRGWLKEMSSTAYQRAVNDMRKAGINPILAATNGGANVGAGSSASISSGKVAQAQGTSPANMSLAGVGNYSGQGYHLSDTFATFGAILGTVGNIMSALQANGGFNNAINTVGAAIKYVDQKIENKRQETIRNSNAPWYSQQKSNNYYVTKEYAKEYGMPKVKA